MLRLLLISLLVGAALATNVRKCKLGPMPTAVSIDGCEKMPCDVVKGTTVGVQVDFNCGEADAETLQTKVRATAFGITVPYQLPEDIANVCKNLKNEQECPLDAGEDATYMFKLPIGSYPEVPVAVEVTIRNQDDEAVSCFIADIKVKSA